MSGRERIEAGDSTQNFAPPAHGHGRAADDFGDVDREQQGVLHDAALKDGRVVVDLSLAHHEGVGKGGHARAAAALSPGRRANRADRGRHDRLRKLHPHHPVGVRQIQLQRRVVAIQRRPSWPSW